MNHEQNVIKAIQFAANKHNGQIRKKSSLPNLAIKPSELSVGI